MRKRMFAILAAGLLVVSVCTINFGSSAPKPSASWPHPPTLGQPVVLDTRVPGWETSAWLAEDMFCVRAARAGDRWVDGKENESIFCDPEPSALDEIGPPLLPAKPLPYLVPWDPGSDEIILVGSTRGDITSVSVTMFGQTATGSVHPLPATRGRQVGAYAVWLPRSGPDRDGMKLSDITAVIGRNAAGDIVAHL